MNEDLSELSARIDAVTVAIGSVIASMEPSRAAQAVVFLSLEQLRLQQQAPSATRDEIIQRFLSLLKARAPAP